MRKGEIVTGSLSGLSFLAAFDAYAGTGTSSWLADLCLSGDTPAPMIEGMPMQDHTQHAAYFASAGLTFLAVALGWEHFEMQAEKLMNTEPQDLARKRLLAVMTYVVASTKNANPETVESAFEAATGHALLPNEADKAFAYLMRDDAPDLHRILAGASDNERRQLLRTVVLTWSSHGMDCDQATQVTERIVALLEFEPDDICKTLDRLWLKDHARKGIFAASKATYRGVVFVCRATVRLTRNAAVYLAPRAKHLSARALATIQR